MLHPFSRDLEYAPHIPNSILIHQFYLSSDSYPNNLSIYNVSFSAKYLNSFKKSSLYPKPLFIKENALGPVVSIESSGSTNQPDTTHAQNAEVKVWASIARGIPRHRHSCAVAPALKLRPSIYMRSLIGRERGDFWFPIGSAHLTHVPWLPYVVS